jgi:hypothetical protein
MTFSRPFYHMIFSFCFDLCEMTGAEKIQVSPRARFSANFHHQKISRVIFALALDTKF